MIDYPYIKTTAKLKEFLQMLPSMGLPKSVSTRWLPKAGFKSANHRPIIRIMAFIGFIKSNKPTDRWRAYQVKKHSRRVLAEGIVDGYRELFAVYPDAQRRSDAELEVFFQDRISASDQAIGATIGTFKALCSLAEFKRKKRNGAANHGTRNALVNKQPPGSDTAAAITPSSSAALPALPAIHTDIQIHIHPDADAEQIREIFKNMAIYLYNRDVD